MKTITTVPVSVIIPFYNGNAFIQRSIDSVQIQTVKPLEILIVEDGSPTPLDTARIQSSFSTAPVPVRILRHEENRGIPAARNTGVRGARGTYVAFLDQDDEWLPKKLEMQWSLVARAGSDAPAMLFYGRALRALENGSWIAWPRTSLMRKLDGRSAQTLRLLMEQGNPLPLITMLFSISAWERAVGFDEDMRGGSDDYGLLLKFAALGFVFCGAGAQGEVIAKRHETGENYSDARRFLKDDVATLERIARDFPSSRPYLKRGVAAAHYRAGRALLESDLVEGKATLRDALRMDRALPRAYLALAAANAPAALRRFLLQRTWNSVRRARAGRVSTAEMK